MPAIVRRNSARSFPGRHAGHIRSALSAAAVGLALVLAVAGCGSNDGGLKMKSHALRIEPLAIAPSPQGAGTFEVQAEGVSEGNAWQTQVYFIPVGADRFEARRRRFAVAEDQLQRARLRQPGKGRVHLERGPGRPQYAPDRLPRQP